MPQLVPGDRFPSITGLRDDGTPIAIPDELEPKLAILLFYRGHW